MTKTKRLTHLSGRNDGRMLLRQPFLLLTILMVAAALSIFVLLPMFNVIRFAVTTREGYFTLAPMFNLMTTPRIQRAFQNSMQLGAIVAVTATFVGYLFAFAVARTEIPCKKFFQVIATFPIVSPPFVLALAVIFLFGRQGLITRGVFGIRDFEVLGLHSLILVQTVTFFPIAFLTLRGILESIDDSVEDAAFSIGASRGRVFRTITLPLSLPGIISSMLLVLILSIEDFANPAVLGGSYHTLVVEVYRIITGMYDLHSGAAVSLFLLVPAVAAYLIQKHWLRKKSFVTVSGKPTQKRRKIHEKHIVYPLFGVCLLISLFIILLYGTVLAGAFFQVWGVNYTFTLVHFNRVFMMGESAITNSIVLAAWATPIGGLLGIAIAYLTVRKRFFGRRAIELTSMLIFAIPGTVLGIGYIASFNTPPLLLTGTGLILVAAFVFRNLPVAVESGTATLLQIDKSIDEASTIAGAGSGYTFMRITLPLLKTAFFSGLVFAFVRAVTAVSTIIFLVSPRWPLATAQVFSIFEGNLFSLAAAYVVVLVVIILTAIAVISIVVQFILKPRAKAPKQELVDRAIANYELSARKELG